MGYRSGTATDAWAVGRYGRTRQQGLAVLYKPLVLHWDGTAWAQVTSPSSGPDSELDSVAALSPTGAWATGGVFPEHGSPTTLVLHWNGTAWTRA